MAGSAAKVVISERQQEVLRKMSTATALAKRLVQRATIILLAFAGLSNEDIARRVGLEEVVVRQGQLLGCRQCLVAPEPVALGTLARAYRTEDVVSQPGHLRRDLRVG